MSTPSREETETAQKLAAAVTETERALKAALSGLDEAGRMFPNEDAMATFYMGQVTGLLIQLRPLQKDFEDAGRLYRSVAASKASEREAHRELYGEEAR